eukprot:gb/GECH01014913.1/.p1 GENE.gb/GECH01014913.1/~~gb/GECH01014913.1/.p1  ORF type:complete len:222 (+),score=48.49 gb/GECH01014913.1/:1-666(+)
MFSVEIIATERKPFTKNTGKRKTTVFYVIRVTSSTGNSWNVKKRFRDFLNLQQGLREAFPTEAQEHLPPLPSSFVLRRLSDRNIEHRRHRLQRYINALTERNSTFFSVLVQDFFKFTHYEPETNPVDHNVVIRTESSPSITRHKDPASLQNKQNSQSENNLRPTKNKLDYSSRTCNASDSSSSCSSNERDNEERRESEISPHSPHDNLMNIRRNSIDQVGR